MTFPNEYARGAIYEVVRRCTNRESKLTPNFGGGGPAISDLYRYITARCAERYGITVLAVCLMGNHMHEILHDRDGRIAAFLQERNHYLAKMINARYGLAGAVFERQTIAYNQLLSPQAVAAKIAYVIANPVAAGLVASPKLWPGLVTSTSDLRGAEHVVARPKAWVSAERNPATAVFRVGVPAAVAAWCGGLDALVRATEAALAEALRTAKSRWSGLFGRREDALRTRPTARPKQASPRGRLRPRFTAPGEPWRIDEARRRRAAWREAHRLQREALRARGASGRERLAFPPGTWEMCVAYGFPSIPTG